MAAVTARLVEAAKVAGTALEGLARVRVEMVVTAASAAPAVAAVTFGAKGVNGTGHSGETVHVAVAHAFACGREAPDCTTVRLDEFFIVSFPVVFGLDHLDLDAYSVSTVVVIAAEPVASYLLSTVCPAIPNMMRRGLFVIRVIRRSQIRGCPREPG